MNWDSLKDNQKAALIVQTVWYSAKIIEVLTNIAEKIDIAFTSGKWTWETTKLLNESCLEVEISEGDVLLTTYEQRIYEISFIDFFFIIHGVEDYCI